MKFLTGFLLGLSFILFVGCGAAKGLIKADLQLMKAEQDAQLVKIQGENSALRLQGEKLEAKLNAQANVIAGFNNRSENVGGDSTKINDSNMIEFIFKSVMDNVWWIVGGLFSFILSLFTGVWAFIRFIVKAKDETIVMISKDKAEAEKRIDEFQNGLINKLVNGKGEKL